MLKPLKTLFNPSHFDMSGWELIPVGVLLLFALGATVHFLKNRSTTPRGPKERRRGTPRQRLNIPMIIETPVTQPFSVKTYDISINGAFIPLSEMKKSMNFTSLIGQRSGIKVGDLIELKLQTGRFNTIQCQGKVVRVGLAGVETEGIGLQFLNINRKDLKRLEQLLYNNEISAVI